MVKKKEGVTGEESHIRALRIWGVLVYAAKNWQVMTYQDLTDASGVWYEGKAQERPLDLIQVYCRRKRLPPLTALVVSGTTGKPTNRSDAEMKVWHRELRRIFKYQWTRKNTPSQGDLMRLHQSV